MWYRKPVNKWRSPKGQLFFFLFLHLIKIRKLWRGNWVMVTGTLSSPWDLGVNSDCWTYRASEVTRWAMSPALGLLFLFLSWRQSPLYSRLSGIQCTHSVARGDLELLILLSLIPKRCGHRHAPPPPVYAVVSIKPKTSSMLGKHSTASSLWSS